MKAKIIAFVLAALISLTALAIAPASAEKSGEWAYTVEDGAAVITKYSGSESELAIPAELDGNKVTAVGKEAFLKCTSLKSVTFPSGVTAIRAEAFSECSALTSVTLPDSLTIVEHCAFMSCKAIERIEVDSGNGAFTSADGVLYSKDGSTLVLCPAGKKEISIPESVTAIGETAFWGCSALESVALPAGLSEIRSRAFYDCSALTGITIPASVTAIGNGAFSGCLKLAGFDVDAGNEAYTAADGILYSADGSTLVACPGAKTAVTIPANVTEVGEWAFPGCTLMKSIDVDSANAVYKSAGGMLLSKDGSTLAVCPGSKKDAVIPEGVTSIAPYAFGRCKNMTSVTVPASVISIGENAFYGCGSLKTVNYTKWRTDWEKIVIADDNDALNNAEINSKTERTRAIVIFIVIGAALAVAIVILSVLKKKKKKTPELPDTAVKKQP